MKTTTEVDSREDVVEIADDTYWVGHRLDHEILHSNPYLRCFENDGQTFNLLIDPASCGDFDVVLDNIRQILGDVEEVDAILLNHQDPDLSASVGRLLDEFIPETPVLCSDDTGELIHNYHDVVADQLVELEDYPDGLKLPTGDVVLPIAAPFCHFRGSTMLYDPATRVVFSGDLFSALTGPEAEGIYAEDKDWCGMRAFHQLYMPTRWAVQKAVDNLRNQQPPVETIAPQHGPVVTGRQVSTFMDRLASLPVGVDVLDDADPEDFDQVLFRVVDLAAETLETETIRRVLSDHVDFDGDRLTADNVGRAGVEQAVRRLCDEVDHATANALRYRAIEAASARELPTPSLIPDETFGASTTDADSTSRFHAL